MLRHFQRGDVGAAMAVMMVAVIVIGLFAGWGMHGSGRDSHGSATTPAAEPNKPALDLLDEKYVRGEISREEYLRKREDLKESR